MPYGRSEASALVEVSTAGAPPPTSAPSTWIIAGAIAAVAAGVAIAIIATR